MVEFATYRALSPALLGSSPVLFKGLIDLEQGIVIGALALVGGREARDVLVVWVASVDVFPEPILCPVKLEVLFRHLLCNVDFFNCRYGAAGILINAEPTA